MILDDKIFPGDQVALDCFMHGYKWLEKSRRVAGSPPDETRSAIDGRLDVGSPPSPSHLPQERDPATLGLFDVYRCNLAAGNSTIKVAASACILSSGFKARTFGWEKASPSLSPSDGEGLAERPGAGLAAVISEIVRVRCGRLIASASLPARGRPICSRAESGAITLTGSRRCMRRRAGPCWLFVKAGSIRRATRATRHAPAAQLPTGA